jgi:Rieske Fe-S protein
VKRREFCTHACQAMSLMAVGTIIQGCGGDSPTSPSGSGGGSTLPVIGGQVVNRTVTLTVDAGSPLATVGGTALVQTTSANILVARISQEAFSALTAVCTHEGCTVTNVSGVTFICPCHGSEYSTGGAVVKGPATRSLAPFGTQFSGNTLVITI